VPAILGALYFVVLGANAGLSKKTDTLGLRPLVSAFQTGCRTLTLGLSQLREFLVEPEFDSGSGEGRFAWHLTAIATDGKSDRLTWHFAG
jgi:hypothetical protein